MSIRIFIIILILFVFVSFAYAEEDKNSPCYTGRPSAYTMSAVSCEDYAKLANQAKARAQDIYKNNKVKIEQLVLDINRLNNDLGKIETQPIRIQVVGSQTLVDQAKSAYDKYEQALGHIDGAEAKKKKIEDKTTELVEAEKDVQQAFACMEYRAQQVLDHCSE